jgi:dCTP deaminase
VILCDREIELALQERRIVIDPLPDPAFIDSTAVDLRLGGSLDRWEFPPPNPASGQDPPRFRPGAAGFKLSELERDFTKSVNIESRGFDLAPLPPGNFILGWTLERIYLPHTARLCARVEGKSSFARMGLGVHVTAPTIHAGFGFNKDDPTGHGRPLRLEIWNVGPLPVELVKRMRICQLILEEVREVPREGYHGQFNIQGPKPAS